MGRGRAGDSAPNVAHLAALREAGRHLHVVEALLAPVLVARPLTHAPEPVEALAAIAQRWRKLPRPVLEAAAERVLLERSHNVRPGDIDAGARWAQTQAENRRVMARLTAKAAEAQAGPVVLQPGTPAHAAYIADHPLDPLGKPQRPDRVIKVSAEVAARYGHVGDVASQTPTAEVAA
jgi:hypothetical protein